jgi:uncharacterized protein (TIGR03643 family)
VEFIAKFLQERRVSYVANSCFQSPIHNTSFYHAIMDTTPPPVDALSAEDRSRIIEMAWEDRTPFEAIFTQFGLRENDVRRLMRRSMKTSSFKLWRERVSGRTTKHEKLRAPEEHRFKSSNQK